MNQTISSEEQDPPQQENEALLRQLNSLVSFEEKLQVCIEMMRDALAQPGSPNFKSFWEVRKLCLPLFKENLPTTTRVKLWADYIELTREGRRLKNLLDEETAFAVEQIELAICGLEEEVQGYHTHLDEILTKTPHVDFPQEVKSIQSQFETYQHLQKQLNLLNVYASRINALRKELMRTEMRIRQKNKFFQKLSILGDRVFPPRKELIQSISETFVQDVAAFVDEHFSEDTFQEEHVGRSIFFFRREIKALQAIAKILTLNTHAFSSTRQMLSECWDKLKGLEKEFKKEYAQHKQQSSENAGVFKERIDAFVVTYQEGNVSLEEGFQQLDEIHRSMRNVSLTRSDVRMLKEALSSARAPLNLKREEEEEAKRQKEAEFNRVRKEKILSFKQQVETLKTRALTEDHTLIAQELDEVRKTLSTLSITKIEKQQLERTLKVIRDQIAEREQQALFDLSDDAKAALEHLQSILTQREERRKEIKAQIEEYRKVLGGSGMDFEKAIRYNELMENEKSSLAKIDENIGDIKKKIRELKKR